MLEGQPCDLAMRTPEQVSRPSFSRPFDHLRALLIASTQPEGRGPRDWLMPRTWVNTAGRRAGGSRSAGQMEDVQHHLSANTCHISELLHTTLTCLLGRKHFLSRIIFIPFFFLGEKEREGRKGGGEERDLPEFLM